MRVSYDKLWKLMKDNKMKKGELSRAIHVSQYTMSNLKNNRPVHLFVIINICKVLHCDVGDVVEIIEDN